MANAELVTKRRIAEAIRASASARGQSLRELGEDWKVPNATLVTLVGTEEKPIAKTIPRADMLRKIAEKTGRSLDYLLGLSDREFRDTSRSRAALEADVGAFIEASVSEVIGASYLADEYRWKVRGDRVLRLALMLALWQAGHAKGIPAEPFTIIEQYGRWREVTSPPSKPKKRV